MKKGKISFSFYFRKAHRGIDLLPVLRFYYADAYKKDWLYQLELSFASLSFYIKYSNYYANRTSELHEDESGGCKHKWVHGYYRYYCIKCHIDK